MALFSVCERATDRLPRSPWSTERGHTRINSRDVQSTVVVSLLVRWSSRCVPPRACRTRACVITVVFSVVIRSHCIHTMEVVASCQSHQCYSSKCSQEHLGLRQVEFEYCVLYMLYLPCSGVLFEFVVYTLRACAIRSVRMYSHSLGRSITEQRQTRLIMLQTCVYMMSYAVTRFDPTRRGVT